MPKERVRAHVLLEWNREAISRDGTVECTCDARVADVGPTRDRRGSYLDFGHTAVAELMN